ETFGGGDGLKAGHTCANDEYASGADGAGGCHHKWKNLWGIGGGKDNGDITGEVGLGGKGIHFLGAGDAREHFEADGADATRSQMLDEVFFFEWIKKADVDDAGFHLVHFRKGRFPDAKEDV